MYTALSSGTFPLIQSLLSFSNECFVSAVHFRLAFSALTWIQLRLAGGNLGLDKGFHRGWWKKGLKLCLVETYLLVDKNTHQPFLYFPQRPDKILLELSFLLFLLCRQSAIVFCSGWLGANNGREKSGKRNTVGRNWGIKGGLAGICPHFFACA